MAYTPRYRITPHFLARIEQAAHLQGEVAHAPFQVSWEPVVRRETMARSAHSSTSIEGNPLTLRQVEAVARGEEIGAPRQFQREIQNYIDALKWIEKKGARPIGEEDVLALHGRIMAGLLPIEKCGQYKARPNYVVSEKGIRIYTPPSPSDTPHLMKELLAWLHSKKVETLHPILVSAIIHHRFVSIHPFSDGNGRVARALGAWVLYQRGYDRHHLVSLDDFFAADRNRYYQMIQQVRELDNDLTYWCDYVAEGIVESLQAVKKRIENFPLGKTSKIRLSPRQEEVLRFLGGRESASMADLQSEFPLTRSRLNQLLLPLVRAGVIKREGMSRATRYRLAHSNR